MLKNALFTLLSVLLVSQVCRADEAQDAQDALVELRETTIVCLNTAFEKYVEMSNNIDTAALDTKASAAKAVKAVVDEIDADCAEKLQRQADDDLARCVDKHAEMAIEHIARSSIRLINEALEDGFHDDGEIIRCGRTNLDCLLEVTDNIRKRTDETPDLVTELIETDSGTTDDHIDMIKACVDEAEENVKKYAVKCTA